MIQPTFVTVPNGDIDIRVATLGAGPLIVCVHGWPELWYSWRHQMTHFAQRGFQVAALDVRGYGGSSKPTDIAAYTMAGLTSDVAAVIEELGNGSAIVFGHDWGAPTAEELWDDYSDARDRMLRTTHDEAQPWFVVNADHKKTARIHVIRHLLQSFDYEGRKDALLDVDDDVVFRFAEARIEDGSIAR